MTLMRLMIELANCSSCYRQMARFDLLSCVADSPLAFANDLYEDRMSPDSSDVSG